MSKIRFPTFGGRMFRVWHDRLNRWLTNIPVDEALVYKEEGYIVKRMDLPFETPPKELGEVK